MDDSIREYILNVFIMVILILTILVILDIYKINLNTPTIKKKLLQVVTIEGMNGSNSFCKSHLGKSEVLDQSCEKLTERNCNSTSCCVYLNGNKCVAGSGNGPTFKTTTTGDKINVDYYYYQNKCYGTNCP